MAEGSLGVILGIKWVILCGSTMEGRNGEMQRSKSRKLLLLSRFFSSSGVSAAFAVKLFKSWINEKDINAVAASLRKVSMDNRLMVCNFCFSHSWFQENVIRKLSFLICEEKKNVFLNLNSPFRNFFLPINKV